MAIVRRRQLKPKPPISDAELLRRAERTAKRAAAMAERERRREATEAANRKSEPKG